MTLAFTTLTERVRTNLVYYNLWSELEVFEFPSGQAIRATPPDKKTQEWVLPVDLRNKMTMSELDSVFEDIKKLEHLRPTKVIFGIYNEDGTIMYYTVYDGIVKPKQS